MNAGTLAAQHAQHTIRASLYRLTALAGIASVVLAAVAFALFGNAPATDASGQAVLTYVATNRVQVLAFVYLFGLSVALMLCFMTGLRALLRDAHQQAEPLATLGLVGGVVWVSVGYGILLFILALAFRAGRDPLLARLLADLGALTANLSGFPTAVNMTAFGAALLLTGFLPRWVAWLACVVALAHLVSAAAYAQEGLLSPSLLPSMVAPLLYYLWVIVVSVILWRRAGTSRGALSPR